MSIILNDVHSQLNATRVLQLHQPRSLEELVALVKSARKEGVKLSQSGGKHAMGGQQFFVDSWHIDPCALNRVLHCDATAGLLEIEAGAHWPEIIATSNAMKCANGGVWSIRQKQTGVDAVSLGGSISANAHGRGLQQQPIVADIENLTLVNSEGEVLFCDRQTNADLFSLVIGGYGMFGIIYAATLRLTPRQCMERVVEVIDLDDAMHAVYRRTAEGCSFGDFQFVIDPHDRGFLHRGVFACYKPSLDAIDVPTSHADLAPEHWLELLRLAHEDKARAFHLYAEHYLSTHGNRYWSDAMQLSTYLPSYADYLEKHRTTEEKSADKESLIIGEHYVPQENLLDFMRAARSILQHHGTEVIYGTIRAILRDTESFLPWAKQDYVCVIFNLRTPHNPAGIEKTANTFRALIDAALACEGSFFLTYHRFASVSQVEAAYPQFRQWLELKKQYDPAELFMSEWYAHYRDAFQQQSMSS